MNIRHPTPAETAALRSNGNGYAGFGKDEDTGDWCLLAWMPLGDISPLQQRLGEECGRWANEDDEALVSYHDHGIWPVGWDTFSKGGSVDSAD